MGEQGGDNTEQLFRSLEKQHHGPMAICQIKSSAAMATAASETMPFRGLGTGLAPLSSLCITYKTEEAISLALPFTPVPKALHLDEKQAPDCTGKWLHICSPFVRGTGSPNKPDQADTPQEATYTLCVCVCLGPTDTESILPSG